MYRTVTKPLPARHVTQALDDMEEIWADTHDALDQETASAMKRDLFKVIGMARGMLTALELRQPDFKFDETDQ